MDLNLTGLEDLLGFLNQLAFPFIMRRASTLGILQDLSSEVSEYQQHRFKVTCPNDRLNCIYIT